MTRRLRWTLTAVGALALAAVLVWAFRARREELAKEREREQPVSAPHRASRGPSGETLVTLDRDARARIGLKVDALTAATLQPELVAFGAIEEDPSRSFTLRAPIGGTLRTSGTRDWPRTGTRLADGAVVGAIEPRVAPATQVDLQSRLATVRAEASAATASLAAARAAFERARTLNAEDKIVSDRALQDAEAKLKGEEARLRGAADNERLIEASLKAATGPTGPLPLAVTRGGEVMEVMAQPGEAIESGQPILRVTRFDTVVARVDVPAGERIDTTVPRARIVLIGHEDQPLRGEQIAQAATDPKTRGQTFLFRVSAESLPLRPGEAVTAYLATPGERQAGVAIPRSAIVRVSGKGWAYVQIGDERFTRREVALDHPSAAGWVVASGFAPGDRVVVEGAQMLLSEELKSRIQVGEQR